MHFEIPVRSAIDAFFVIDIMYRSFQVRYLTCSLVSESL